MLNKYDEKHHFCIIIGSVFLKKKHLKATKSQITQSLSGLAFEHETINTGNMQGIQHVNKC